MPYRIAGIVNVDQEQFKESALARWSRHLSSAVTKPLRASRSVISIWRQRVAVQRHLHTLLARLRGQAPIVHVPHHEGEASATKEFPQVPVVVRLGVLALFPLLEAMVRTIYSPLLFH